MSREDVACGGNGSGRFGESPARASVVRFCGWATGSVGLGTTGSAGRGSQRICSYRL